MLFAPRMAQNPKQHSRREKLAANGRLPATLPEPIGANSRICAVRWRGQCGGGARCSAPEPDEHKIRESAGGVLAAVQIANLFQARLTAGGPGADMEKLRIHKISNGPFIIDNR